MKPYAYRCKDYSLLTPIFKKVLVNPLIAFLPWAIPANVITIISNSFFYLALCLSFYSEQYGTPVFLVIPLLLLAYLIGDHLDGAQAKRTNTGSALGEFCDHYLDAFNNGILMMILFNLFRVNNDWLILLVMTTSYWAHVIVFYEQFKTGWLIFEKIGSLEGVLLAIILIVSLAYPPIFSFYQRDLVFGLSFIELLLHVIAFGAVVTLVKTVFRIPNVRYSLVLYIIGSIILAWFCYASLNTWQSVTVLTLYSALYLGKIMTGHLIDGLERSPGLFTPLLALIIIFTDFYEAHSFLIVLIYLSASIVLLIFRTFLSLSQYWVWSNPKRDEKN